MTAKEKAKELVELYCQLLSIRDYENKDLAKQCALICCDEIWKELDVYSRRIKYDFYQQVRNEILNY